MMIDANEAVKEGFAKINQATAVAFFYLPVSLHAKGQKCHKPFYSNCQAPPWISDALPAQANNASSRPSASG
ncbi:hypothetical protein AE07_02266 [Enterobacter cloacae BWH 43]|nr:hypothetical protein AE07_02266 [Enterobacter cloacae BWH 43]